MSVGNGRQSCAPLVARRAGPGLRDAREAMVLAARSRSKDRLRRAASLPVTRDARRV
jgi:hypothetical protein